MARPPAGPDSVLPMPGPILDSTLRNPIGTHVPVGKGLAAGALARADGAGLRDAAGLRRQPPRLGALGRAAARGPRLPGRDRRARRAGLHPRALPREPRLPHPGDLRAVRRRRRPQPAPRGRDRRRGRRRAHRLVRGPRTDPARARAVRRAMRQVRDGLLPLLDALRPGDGAPWLLLEPTAGQGRSLCAGVEDLAPYLAALDDHPRPASASTPATSSPPARRSTSPAAPRPRSTGSSRSAAPAGCGWCTPTTRWTCAARSRTGTRPSGDGPHRQGRVRRAVRPPGDRGRAVRAGDARLAGRPATCDLPLLKQLRETAHA